MTLNLLLLIAAIFCFLLAALLSIANGDIGVEPLELTYIGLAAFAAAHLPVPPRTP